MCMAKWNCSCLERTTCAMQRTSLRWACNNLKRHDGYDEKVDVLDTVDLIFQLFSIYKCPEETGILSAIARAKNQMDRESKELTASEQKATEQLISDIEAFLKC